MLILHMLNFTIRLTIKIAVTKLTRSPTRNFELGTNSGISKPFTSLQYFCALTSLSLLYLLKSSIASRKIVTVKTKHNGPQYVYKYPILMSGINWDIAMSRKYKFKKNLNC